MNDRLTRLQERLEQPLLVTNPVNVVYLVGFHSSNCALFVDRTASGSSPTSATSRPRAQSSRPIRREQAAARRFAFGKLQFRLRPRRGRLRLCRWLRLRLCRGQLDAAHGPAPPDHPDVPPGCA